MAEITADAVPAPPKKRPLKAALILLVLIVVGFLAGFSGTYLGYLQKPGHSTSAEGVTPLPNVAFLSLEPILINLGPASRGRVLRFAATIEVEAAYKADVELLRPRILDLMNSYLRAVDPAEYERTAALVKLRAQLLRRLQVIVGDGRVRDLLITEFVIS